MMKRRYDRGVVINVFIWLLFAWSHAGAADTPPDKASAGETTYHMTDMVVSATRSQVPENDVATNISVITREEIAAMPVATAAEVLRFVPGVYVESAGGIGSEATIRIQGSDPRHVAVYQDGVPLNLLANPFADLSLIPVAAIDRIEVYQGAASSAWGSALGGVINIITREPAADKAMSAEAQASYGEADTTRNYASLQGTVDRWGYFVSLTRDASDGFVDKSAYEQQAAYGKVNYTIGDTGRLNLVCNYDDGHKEDPIINYPDFWDDMERTRAYQRLLLETFPEDTLSLTLEARHQDFDALIEDVYADHREPFSDYREESWGGSVRATYEPAAFHTMNLGFDGDWGRYDDRSFSGEYDTGNWAVYGNDTLRWRMVSINTGLRYDHNQDFGSEMSPSLGLVCRLPGDRALIRAQAASGFSAPPPSWVNDPFGGNPDLDPETAMNYQLGGEIQALSWLRLEVNGFYSSVKDLIQPDWERMQYVNIDEVLRKGASGGLTVTAFSPLRLSFFGTFTDVQDQQNGQTVTDIPRVQYQASAVHAWQWLTQSLHGDYIYYNSSYPETEDQVFVFDYLARARLPWGGKLCRPELFGAVHNLFDVDYVYRSVWPQPGRWVEAGVRLNF
ncbi:MAG: TonB-dependent receptor [Thermodesulfobacteriota bacterium]